MSTATAATELLIVGYNTLMAYDPLGFSLFTPHEEIIRV